MFLQFSLEKLTQLAVTRRLGLFDKLPLGLQLPRMPARFQENCRLQVNHEDQEQKCKQNRKAEHD
jgi:hypothetical protein